MNSYDYKSVNYLGRVVKEHIVIASIVLGRPLPSGVIVHHVNGDGRDNRHSNLVICQDQKYHKLLHYRQRLMARGVNPDTHFICGRCDGTFALSDDTAHIGRGTPCRACRGAMKAAQRKRNADTRRAAISRRNQRVALRIKTDPEYAARHKAIVLASLKRRQLKET